VTEIADDNQPSRLQEALEVLMRLAAGDFSARADMSGCGDEMDALIAGINMLGEEIAAKFGENERLLRELEQSVAEMAAKNRTIMSLSTPSLLVWRGIVVLPLIGMLDQERAEKLSAELLNQIQHQTTGVVIVDITGVAVVDTTTADHLLKTFAAARLLGTRGILTGLSPANARTLARLEVDLGAVAVRGSLHDGLRLAFTMTGRRVLEDRATDD
jgi:rsbT co-antagonist protein RsbR